MNWYAYTGNDPVNKGDPSGKAQCDKSLSQSQYKTGDDQYRRAIMQWADEPSAGFNTTGNFWLDQGKWFPWAQNHEGWFTNYW